MTKSEWTKAITQSLATLIRAESKAEQVESEVERALEKEDRELSRRHIREEAEFRKRADALLAAARRSTPEELAAEKAHHALVRTGKRNGFYACKGKSTRSNKKGG